MSENLQLSTAIAIAVPMTVVTLLAIDVAASVTTPCMPLMSLVRRLCSSPPRVRVKNPRGWRCRWENRSVRSVCMTRWPVRVASQVCTTPRSCVTIVTARMPPTSVSNSGTSWCGMASSMRCLVRNGGASAMTALTTMIASTTAMDTRCGAKSRVMRRMETGWASSWAMSALLTRMSERPAPWPGPGPWGFGWLVVVITSFRL